MIAACHCQPDGVVPAAVRVLCRWWARSPLTCTCVCTGLEVGTIPPCPLVTRTTSSNNTEKTRGVVTAPPPLPPSPSPQGRCPCDELIHSTPSRAPPDHHHQLSDPGPGFGNELLDDTTASVRHAAIEHSLSRQQSLAGYNSAPMAIARRWRSHYRWTTMN